MSAVLSVICNLCPDIVHFGGPHLWNVPLVRWLEDKRIRVGWTFLSDTLCLV